MRSRMTCATIRVGGIEISRWTWFAVPPAHGIEIHLSDATYVIPQPFRIADEVFPPLRAEDAMQKIHGQGMRHGDQEELMRPPGFR